MPALLPDQWPLLLGGPLLRRVTPRSVCVFLALKAPCDVRLTVLPGLRSADAWTSADEIANQVESTVPLGKHLHVLAIEAEIPAAAELEPGQLYSYDLMLTPVEPVAIPGGVLPAGQGTTLSEQGLLGGRCRSATFPAGSPASSCRRVGST